MKSQEFYISTKPEMSHWLPVLRKWCEVVWNWVDRNGEDRPWWQLEIANAGLLSASAIACGHVSAVETDVPKYRLGTSKEYFGRSDLWILFSGEGLPDSLSEFIEIKQSIVTDGEFNLAGIHGAVEDASNVRWPCRAKIGACFYTLNSTRHETFGSLVDLNEELRCASDADAVASVFPEKIRVLGEASDSCFSPGVSLVLKLVPRLEGLDTH